MKAVSTSSTLVALLLIDVLQVSGHLQHARQLSDEIIDFARARSERVYLPELLRQRGGLLARKDRPAAIQSYREAIELARATGALGLERRAAESLALATTKK